MTAGVTGLVPPSNAAEVIDSVPTNLWIGNRQAEPCSARRFDVVDPATGALLARVADAGPTDAMRALDVASRVQPMWAATPARQRSEIIWRVFESVISRAEQFAAVMTLEMGKPLAESRKEVVYGAEFLRWFAEEAVRIGGRTAAAVAGPGQIVVTKEPVGPVLAITPWNFPLAMGTRKIAPALAAGCTIIVKPAPETPLTMQLLGQVFADAGLPEGVLSILPTSSAAALSEPLIRDPRLRKLTFTGSTPVGKHLVKLSANRLLRTSMELGGNAPLLVFEDADLDTAVQEAVAAKFRNGGQACTAANRFYVAQQVVEEFVDRLVSCVSSLRLGPGTAPSTDIGPLISARQVTAVAALVDDATARGARIRAGGKAPACTGYYYEPTVLDTVSSNARLLREEIFGPVAPVVSFVDEDEAIAAANDTEYGLAAYVFSRDVRRIARVSRALKVGMIGVNRGVISDAAAPFGGVKESGYGREGGLEGIDEYLDVKYIAQ
ncbi:NAD-dependent succinate-semialdehyde dehydrogenase [Mycobacterium sp. E2479]|uniref:NAD-dependent succinate-semialdehyde dehydrogenase n=1 Tax=Mycobacterium sp. E2479 TaxID=1834134 RepID=UPI0007FF0A9C|nr:NAD-dependent succinate-semialdehyde dehydrogenase [Mycobacterium sp. E2479]OBH52849.1 NAD-dependent succinate-semialdehyde dehydrogenase [Mycobacterium sp. E2479]